MQVHRTAALLALVPLGALAAAGIPAAQVATYRLTVENTWDESHPAGLPAFAHFSSVGGASHHAGVSFWDVGELASPGIQEMAEIGGLIQLFGEVQAAVAAGTAWSPMIWGQWFCAEGVTYGNCGQTVVQFQISATHPLVTLVTMLGPSPDWFVGVSGLRLRDEGGWIDELVVPLHPFDAGTRDANTFDLGGPLTTPPVPISAITTESGQLIGPGALGSFTFERLVAFVNVDTNSISVTTGGAQNFSLNAGVENAGKLYWMFGSATGTSPGIPGTPHLPLNLDLYFLLTIQYANLPPWLGTLGFLDASGKASCSFALSADDDSSLAGVHLNHAYAVYDIPGTGVALYTSDPVTLSLVP